VQEDT